MAQLEYDEQLAQAMKHLKLDSRGTEKLLSIMSHHLKQFDSIDSYHESDFQLKIDVKYTIQWVGMQMQRDLSLNNDFSSNYYRR